MQTGLFRSRIRSLSFRNQVAPISPRLLRPSPLQWRLVHTHRYTPEHELVKFDDQTGLGIISITHHAQDSLGDVVFVELPKIGTKVVKGESIGAVESVKAASDIYAPVSGTIEDVNESLADRPGLLNKSPEDLGWLCKIKLSNPSEMDELMTREEYTAKIEF